MKTSPLDRLVLSEHLREMLCCVDLVFPESRDHLLELAYLETDKDLVEVAYDVPGKGRVVEATVGRCKNGAAVNYVEPYMRRRDPDAMVIADDRPTDKPHWNNRFKQPFEEVRQETFRWFREDVGRLIVLPFLSGDKKRGYPTLLIAPENAGFFVAGLADLQGFFTADEIPENFEPRAVIYLAPPFRHTHFDGKQVVVHNRLPGMHELFAYNLYPGPSAKKGVYGILLSIGEEEDWVTLHSSAVRVVTPYDNEFVIMHEGASGGGKSEMTQQLHREPDGRIRLAHNTITGDDIYFELLDPCELEPVTDDMALAHPSIQTSTTGRLMIEDAEAGWFLRVDHLNEYGKEPAIEKLCINPPEPLIFLNLEGKPGSTILPWEHIQDEPGKPCPNPRVIMPRHFIDKVVDDPVAVDVRSFGVRTPPSTKKNPNYGIIGMMHILPPALAWLWRLVAPRGHANPSIVTTEGLTSEGVGSYWPFATGKKVTQANLLLKVTQETPGTPYVLIPNQYIGAYKVGFQPEWILREYMARRGSVKFRPEQLIESRCPLLGYSMERLKVAGQLMPAGLLHVHEQPEVGIKGYDAGQKILADFFKKEVSQFLTDDLDPLGRKIIDVCMNDGTLQDYIKVFNS
ncbi:protein of unknown function [Alkalispirochaeta americana]|uniref:DUF4914 domain-containing protein n=1 Tax=Alkalispirochaeta americana TaxID=159291 RepID=A0A1N6TLA0_9SPIO|nr:DUF4914 family protein [Alkalispirochaeta americana]SIQ54004.1 protein of unknown function [Alkalispirochaeta americana]